MFCWGLGLLQTQLYLSTKQLTFQKNSFQRIVGRINKLTDDEQSIADLDSLLVIWGAWSIEQQFPCITSEDST